MATHGRTGRRHDQYDLVVLAEIGTSDVNALSPTLMSPRERIEETASILAAGLVRLRLRTLSRIISDYGESFVDLPGNKSGHDSAEAVDGAKQ